MLSRSRRSVPSRPRSRVAFAAVMVGTFALTAACTGSSPSNQPSGSRAASGAPRGGTSAPPVAVATPTPVTEGPTTTSRAQQCPLVAVNFVHLTMGVRLGRLTVQHSDGRVVGCRFYALQSGPLHTSERLPGPNQPVLEVSTSRYRTAVEAHNAFVLLARRNSNATTVALGGGAEAVCFQDDFDPHDRGRDWSCTTSTATTQFVVRSVDTTGTFNTAAVLRRVLRGH